jgi:hypothetical protein
MRKQTQFTINGHVLRGHPQIKVSWGEYPPPGPENGDIWIDKFLTQHFWSEHYWIKMPMDTEAVWVANFYQASPEALSGIWFGFGAPETAMVNCYWVDINQKVYKSIATNIPTHPPVSWVELPPSKAAEILTIIQMKIIQPEELPTKELQKVDPFNADKKYAGFTDNLKFEIQ